MNFIEKRHKPLVSQSTSSSSSKETSSSQTTSSTSTSQSNSENGSSLSADHEPWPWPCGDYLGTTKLLITSNVHFHQVYTWNWFKNLMYQDNYYEVYFFQQLIYALERILNWRWAITRRQLKKTHPKANQPTIRQPKTLNQVSWLVKKVIRKLRTEQLNMALFTYMIRIKDTPR